MNDTVLKVALAGLLHDIGKFAQRARRPYSKDMQGSYLPSFKGLSSHWHALYTDYFIEKDLPLPADLDADRGRIARIASAHHRPDETNLIEMAVSIGDSLSAGTDRIVYEESEEGPDFRHASLLSIFDEVELNRHSFKPPGQWFHKLTPVQTGTDAIFPVRDMRSGNPEDYEKLFEKFLVDLNCLNVNLPLPFYLDSLVSLLEKYTWSIPASSYESLADISLYDHAVTTAAITQALYTYHDEKKTTPKRNDPEEKFLLLVGDLSGIQNYIFGISKNSGRGVSKIFRARSFYLQALVKSSLISIERRLGVSSVCKIMDAGGKFILLLPNLVKMNERLVSLDEALQSWFRGKFKGLLTLNLDWQTRLAHKDFALAEFQKKIDQVNDNLEYAKLSKLKRTMTALGPIVNTDYDEFEGGNCSICDVNRADAISSEKYATAYDVASKICRDCYQQIDIIGTDLPKKDFHVYGASGQVELFDGIFLAFSEQAPRDLNQLYRVETFNDNGGFSRSRIARYMPSIRQEELIDEKWFKVFSNEEGFDPKVDQSKTFNAIAQKSKKELKGELVGRPLLSFMKADVDNLGFIFGLGLGNCLSMSRFSFLSRMLNLFFSDYLVDLVKREFPDIYVVFSGGDDLFVVGPWRQTLQFAGRLRRDFSRFCGNNPDITLSAGILIGRPRLPIRRAAEQVEELLDKSKARAVSGQRKDAVTVLNETLTWPELICHPPSYGVFLMTLDNWKKR